MPLPFILGGVAIGVALYGAKKSHGDVQALVAATTIVNNAQTTYEEKKITFDSYNEKAEKNLNQLRSLHLKIGTDFGKFKTIAQQLIDKNTKIDIPQYKLDKINYLEISAISYLGKGFIVPFALPLAFASYVEEALSDAHKTEREVNEAVRKMDLYINQLDKINIYSSKINNKIETIYTNYFLPYFEVLQDINKRKENGDDISNLDTDILRAVGNGYQVAAILADIIATPLFKPKMNKHGKVAIDGENVVEFETDYNNLRVLNTKSIDDALFNCISKSSEYKP